MSRIPVILILLFATGLCISFTRNDRNAVDSLRKIYSQHPSSWPRPNIESGITWTELGVLPESPIMAKADSLKNEIELGKILFFDQRISGSGKIACASCHRPELSWTDGLSRSQGHEGAMNRRNSPSIQNVWFYKKLFWDGRSRDLEDQAFAPINSESEMHGDMRELPFKLKKIKSYPSLFNAAFGDPSITPDRIASALANFQRTVVSRKSRFDLFLLGKKNALTDKELKGLHIFRTKAGCMNCHNGPLFTDNKFHNVGFHAENNPENDPGLYNVTHKEEDRGKFRTPSLRDVMKTGPWMHNGLMTNMSELISNYNQGTFSHHDPLLKPLNLSKEEQDNLVEFLKSISSKPLSFTKPVLPE